MKMAFIFVLNLPVIGTVHNIELNDWIELENTWITNSGRRQSRNTQDQMKTECEFFLSLSFGWIKKMCAACRVGGRIELQQTSVEFHIWEMPPIRMICADSERREHRLPQKANCALFAVCQFAPIDKWLAGAGIVSRLIRSDATNLIRKQWLEINRQMKTSYLLCFFSWSPFLGLSV